MTDPWRRIRALEDTVAAALIELERFKSPDQPNGLVVAARNARRYYLDHRPLVTDLEWRGFTLPNGRDGVRRHVRLVLPSRHRTRIVCHDTDWVGECLDALTDFLRATARRSGPKE